uniref:DSBA domain-containing protein n=1 Tax=Heterorhabditis bacteriophora TaxID=37862 RepID=A0A1I7XIE8_HETBA
MVDSDEVKIKLRKNTDEALANGCFGAPWIHVHMGDGRMEPFFGSDRLPLIANLIGEEYKGPLTELAKF